MNKKITKSLPINDFKLWEKYNNPDKLYTVNFEITARCNLNCRHCYINLPVSDMAAATNELTIDEISRIADEAMELGAVWSLVSGGEPLLRKDFDDIYIMLKRKGLLLTVFTNATLVQDRHIELFTKYPPRDLEVTVYGASKDTYEKVTRKSGAFDRFIRNLYHLQKAGVRVRLKAMAMRSNVHEMEQIAEFCREYTKDYFRYDPNLHYRFDGNKQCNEQIKAERLSAQEIIELEQNDQQRSQAIQDHCDDLMLHLTGKPKSNKVFKCGVGNGSVTIGADGQLRLCSDLFHPDFMFDLRKGSLAEALEILRPRVRNLTSDNKRFLNTCASCSIVNFCQWCPADAWLETGVLDKPINHFCKVAHARVKAIEEVKSNVPPV